VHLDKQTRGYHRIRYPVHPDIQTRGYHRIRYPVHLDIQTRGYHRIRYPVHPDIQTRGYHRIRYPVHLDKQTRGYHRIRHPVHLDKQTHGYHCGMHRLNVKQEKKKKCSGYNAQEWAYPPFLWPICILWSQRKSILTITDTYPQGMARLSWPGWMVKNNMAHPSTVTYPAQHH